MHRPTNKTSPSEHIKNGNWLQRLKDESWEAELLVSAIAIFGTFQLFGLVDWATNKFIDLLPVEQYEYGYFISFMGLLAVSILVSMFIIHFSLRAYWIGLVGLNSVFPDYGIEDSAYSKIYTSKLLKVLPRQEDTIQKVDELCSVIFSAAFTILLIYAYMSLLASGYILLFNLLSSYVPAHVLLIPALLLGILVTVQSILTIVGNIKRFKEIEWLQNWSFKIVRLASMLLYGPLYKNILQVSMVFGSNFKKKKWLVRLVLLFFVSGICLSVIKIKDTNIYYLLGVDRYYADQMYLSFYENQSADKSFLLTPQIQSDLIEGQTVRLFIPVFQQERNYQESTCGTYEDDASLSQNDNTLSIRAFYLKCYENYHTIKLNGELLTMNILKKNHPVSGQFGIVTYIDKQLLKSGENTIMVTKTLGDVKEYNWSIPFYFQPNTRTAP
ncbi:hypothetical protein [Maribacter sp. MAR_2009_72]|uniref:hypothetical protein n=1 Tax=Maribacter sp. MAR_2009_72 TaxID=1250050 RepID=UPI00119A29E6|nr:hypothetical protein [Maribacter sp. MAR_2009_72]TVZ15314.1 hypothetical protein JM81_1541 [Maribacter sp. MAR_2009_72]